MDAPLVGSYPATADELAEKLPAAAAYPARDVAQLYLLWSERFGFDVRVPWGQMLLETNGLRYTGEVTKDLYNFCGLRLPDGSGYYKFDSIEHGVVAHLAHLALHAYPDHCNQWCNSSFDPKHSRWHLNDVKTLADLGKGKTAWCPTPGYAESIVRAYNEGV